MKRTLAIITTVCHENAGYVALFAWWLSAVVHRLEIIKWSDLAGNLKTIEVIIH